MGFSCPFSWLTKKKSKNLLSPGHVLACSSLQEIGRNIIWRNTLLITRNLGPCSWFEYRFLLFALSTKLQCNPYFSCSYSLIWISYWYWWLFWAADYLAQQDTSSQVNGWIFFPSLFSIFHIFPRQGTSLEPQICTGRIVLHLNSAMMCHPISLETRFS